MCVKIITPDNELTYDMEQPLEPQIKEAKQVVINYDPQDPSISKFLNEIERCTQNGMSLDLNFKVKQVGEDYGNYVEKEKPKKDEQVNDLIRALAHSYSEAERKLEELANHCFGRN